MIDVQHSVRLQPVKKADAAEDRGTRMVAMKAEGKTQREIAEAFGISIDRVRQLMARTQSRARMHAAQPNRAGLSVRTQGVLLALIVEPEVGLSERDRALPARVATLTRTKILNLPNAGHRTIAEIEAWLRERGLDLSGDA